MSKTTSDLISNIQIRGSFPSSQDLFSNSNFLQILDDEMMNVVVPLLTKTNEEYFLCYKDISLTANQEAYRIPKRAVGSMLRDIQKIDSSGNITSLPRLFEEDKTSITSGGALGYYLKGNQVLISPIPTQSSGTVRFVYYRRPSKFVLPSACAQIQSIDTVLNQVIVSSLPSTITVNTPVDFIQANSPYDLLEMDIEITGVSGTTLSFNAIPEDLEEGDYISLAGESCVPMIPEELIPLLVQAALCTCLSSKKDKSVELELQKLEQMKQTMLSLLSPRVRSNDVKVKNHNSLLNHFRF